MAATIQGIPHFGQTPTAVFRFTGPLVLPRAPYPTERTNLFGPLQTPLLFSHNPKVEGSNPSPATTIILLFSRSV